MQKTHFLQYLHDRFSSRTNSQQNKSKIFKKEWELLSQEEKKKLANQYLLEGEKKIANSDITAIESFDIATLLDSNNPLLRYRLASTFSEYGISHNDKNALLFAHKNLKIATNQDASNFDFWKLWGTILYHLAILTNQAHYLILAKQKLQKAILSSHNQPKETLAKLYEEYALIWLNLAKYSGEAVDIRSAIQAFRSSLAHQENPSTIFWYHFGNAYYMMASLINDNRLFLKAIDYFKKAIDLKGEILFSLAETYTQLYINTLNKEFFNQANDYFHSYSKQYPNDSDLWLRWAQLLAEEGKKNQDPKRIRQSIEKCVCGIHCNTKDPFLIGQWVESLSLLGVLTNRLDFITEAEKKIINGIDSYSEIPELWYAYGICLTAYASYYNDPDYEEEAIEKFQIGLSLDRTNAELWQALASCHKRLGIIFDNEELLERACKFYLKAIDLKPCCPNITIEYGLTLSKLGELTENKFYLEEAIWQFETTLQTQKTTLLHHPEWLYYYGQALDLLGKHEEELENHHLKAVEIFHQVLLLEPTFPKIYYSLALALSHAADYMEDLHFFEKSIWYFRLAAKQDEEDDLVWLEWGLTLISLAQQTISFDIQQQLYLDAERKLNRAGILGNQHAFYYLGCLYSLLGRFEEAIFMLQKADKAEILPDNEDLLSDEWLESLRQTDLFNQFLTIIKSKTNFTDER